MSVLAIALSRIRIWLISPHPFVFLPLLLEPNAISELLGELTNRRVQIDEDYSLTHAGPVPNVS